MRALSYSVFDDVNATNPIQHRETWEQFAVRFSTHRERSERSGKLWSPAEYPPGALRAKANVSQVHFLVLDVEDGRSVADLTEGWADYEYLCHSTYHHITEAPRFRVIFPLAEPVPGERWDKTWHRFKAFLAFGDVDHAPKHAAALYWPPISRPGDADRFAFVNEGKWLSETDLPPIQKPDPPHQEAATVGRPTARSQELPSSDRASRAARIIETALQIMRGQHPKPEHGHGRQMGAFYAFVQLRDNRFDAADAVSVMVRCYLPSCPPTNTKGEGEPFDRDRLQEICEGVYRDPPRKAWDSIAAIGSYTEEEYAAIRDRVFGRTMDTSEATRASSVPADEPETRSWRTFRFRDLAEMELEEPAFPVERLLREGINLFLGKTGDGKTWWSLDAACAISAGGYALGHRPVLVGDVLYLALEESRAEMFQRLLQIRDDGQQFDRLQIACVSDLDWPMAHSYEALAAIDDWLDQHPEARLVVLDPLLAYMAAAAPQSAIVQAEYNIVAQLRHVARKHPGVAILVHDHRSKAPIAGGREAQDTGVHSTGLIAAADNRLTLVREEGQLFRLHVRGRMVPQQELHLRFEPQIGGWELVDDARTIRHSEVEAAILRELALSDEPAHYRRIAEAIGATVGTVKGRLFRLARKEKIVRVAEGTYALPEN